MKKINKLYWTALSGGMAHIVKRDDIIWWKAWGIRIVSVFLALIVCGFVTVSLTEFAFPGIAYVVTMGDKKGILTESAPSYTFVVDESMKGNISVGLGLLYAVDSGSGQKFRCITILVI